MGRNRVYRHEWLFSERCLLITVMARTVEKSRSRLIKFARYHLCIPIQENDMDWDYSHDVGYVDERKA